MARSSTPPVKTAILISADLFRRRRALPTAYRAEAHGIVAESLITVAFALQLLTSVILILSAAVITSASLEATAPALSTLRWFVPIGIAIGIGTGLLLIVAYKWSYVPARRGYYLRARTPTLALGVLFVVLIFTVVIGVLYLFAYGRLRDAEPDPDEVV